MDVFACVTLLVQYYNDTQEYKAPAYESPCLDVADSNGQGITGGDGWIDIGDLIYIAEVVSSYCSTMPPYYAPCLPESFTTTGGAEIDLIINNTPWDEISPVSPNDIVRLLWIGTDTFEVCNFYNGGFCNFNLNVSKGEYRYDFDSIFSSWAIRDFNITSDFQGGIDVGGGAYSGQYIGESYLVIFSFSFRIPDVSGPAYTINISPNKGSWRLILFDQLPSIQLQVLAKEPQCVNPPKYDLNNDCRVNFFDFALLVSEWLDCGYDDPAACLEN